MNIKSAVLIAFSAACFGQTWTQQFQDNFTRANSATVGNGWTDAAGGVYSIASNLLAGSTSNSSGYLANFLTRPSAEAAQDQRAVVVMPSFASGEAMAIVVRHQASKSNYLCSASPSGGGNHQIYYISGSGSVASLWASTAGVNTTDSYSVDCSATGVNPTTITFTLTDVSTSTVVFTHAVTDSTSDVQNATGVTGLLVWPYAGTATLSASLYTSYTVGGGGSTMTISPVTYIGAGAVTVAVTGTGTAFTGTPFTVAGTPSVAITSQSVLSATSATVTLVAGSFAGYATITDTGSGATATLQLFHPPTRSLAIGYIGDSITAGTNGNPVGTMGSYLQARGYQVTQVNAGISGTSTADWANGTNGASLPNSISAFKAAGVKYVPIMLGTNDARTPNQFSVATHHANMTTIVNAMTGAGFVVVLHQPIWTLEGSSVNGVTWPAGVNVLYQQYYVADLALVNGNTVLAGDTEAFDWFEANPSHLQDGVHPTGGGNVELGNFWAQALLRAMR